MAIVQSAGKWHALTAMVVLVNSGLQTVAGAVGSWWRRRRRRPSYLLLACRHEAVRQETSRDCWSALCAFSGPEFSPFNWAWLNCGRQWQRQLPELELSDSHSSWRLCELRAQEQRAADYVVQLLLSGSRKYCQRCQGGCCWRRRYCCCCCCGDES